MIDSNKKPKFIESSPGQYPDLIPEPKNPVLPTAAAPLNALQTLKSPESSLENKSPQEFTRSSCCSFKTITRFLGILFFYYGGLHDRKVDGVDEGSTTSTATSSLTGRRQSKAIPRTLSRF